MNEQKMKAVIVTAGGLGDDPVEQQKILEHFAAQAEKIIVWYKPYNDYANKQIDISTANTNFADCIEFALDPDHSLKENGQFKAKHWHEVDNTYLAFMDKNVLPLEDVLFVTNDVCSAEKMAHQYRFHEKMASKKYEKINVLFVKETTLAGIQEARAVQRIKASRPVMA